MLWVKFNSNGQYIGEANVGSLPFAGTDEFQIFAVFEDVNLENYGSAAIKLYKPDLAKSSVISLPMVKRDEANNNTIEFDGETNDYFTHGTYYSGFYFDFKDYVSDGTSEILDTAGLWRAVITLMSINSTTYRNVVGSVTFEVGNGNESEESHDADIEALLTMIYNSLGQKLNIASSDYVKTVNDEDISLHSFEDAYHAGDIVVNRYDLKVYQLDENKEPTFKLDLLDLYTKEEVDLLLNDKLDKKFTTGTFVYTHNGSTQGQNVYTPNVVSDGIVQRDSNGEINVPTTPTDNSKATSKSYVDDNIQNVREVAEGKSKSLVIRYSITAPTTDVSATMFKKPDGTYFTDLADFNSYVSGLTIANPSFNTQDNVNLIGYYLIGEDYIVYKGSYLKTIFKVGDIILVVETDVPDRWVLSIGSSYMFLGKLETTKVDLTSYATIPYVDNGLAQKQNKLIAGENITIENNVISATGGSGGGAWGEITGDIQDQTDLQNELTNIREVAEGKNKTLVIRYNIEAPTTDSSARMYKKIDGTVFTNLADFNSYVSGLSIANPSFNTQDNLMLTNYYIIGDDFIVYRDNDIHSNFKVGDIILVIQTNVPDRWFSFIYSEGAILSKLETTKVDLTGYATKTELGESIENLAQPYDSTTSYAVGEVVIYNSKLYRCTTAIAVAEEWDSTHWEQINVASDFVNLTGTQTISGEKTFESGITFKGGTKEAVITCDPNSGLVVRDATTGGGIMTRYITGTGPSVIPYGASSLGHPNAQWKDLYLNGTIYGASNVFNVINANDIENNTLTEAQYNLITNGKPTLISGTYGTRYNIWLLVGQEYSGNYCCECSFSNQFGAHYRTAIRIPTTSPYTLSFNNSGIYFNYQGDNVAIPSLNSVNGKTIPNYPSSPTIAQQLIYDTDNSLKWLGAGLIDFGELTSDTSSTVIDYINENGGKFIYTDANLNKWCCIKSPKTSRSGQLASLCYICSVTGEGGNFYLGLGYINTSTKEFSHQRDIFTGVVHSDALDNLTIKKINTKDIKFYQNNVFPYVNNTGTEIKYETINDISVSANTTFTLAAAPGTTYPEYKVNLTNSASSAVTLTFTGVSKVKTNDSSLTITEGTNSVVVLPAGASVELNIQNGKMIVFNWEA